MSKCICVGPGACTRDELLKNRQQFLECEQKGVPLPCVYLDKEQREEDGHKIYGCRVFGQCTLKHYHINVQNCENCGQRVDPRGNLANFKDPLEVVTATREKTHALRGILRGAPSFLVGGGPSVLSLDYASLGQNGVFSLGVNNIAAVVPVRAFICSDPVNKFHDQIFTNPTMMKFVPVSKLSHKIRIKKDKEFEIGEVVSSYPNVWGYQKRGWSAPDRTFFTEPSAALGNFDEGVIKLGAPKAVLTLLAAIRVLYYLGSRTIYLVGCDFNMTAENPYAFEQSKDLDGVEDNNSKYQIIGKHLEDLRPVFTRFGLFVFNTNRDSGLKAFPFVPFDRAITRTLEWSGLGVAPSLSSWYEK